MPKLLDPVAIRVNNPITGEVTVEGGFVVATHDIDPEWNPDGDVVTIRTFTPDGVDTVGTQFAVATYDDNGVWTDGYVTIDQLDAAVESLSKLPPVVPSQENPTAAASGGVSAAQLNAAIQANNDQLKADLAQSNADLLLSIQGLLSGQSADAADAPAPPADAAPAAE